MDIGAETSVDIDIYFKMQTETEINTEAEAQYLQMSFEIVEIFFRPSGKIN